MSRITKFLNQKCQHSKAIRDASGRPILNRYGEVQLGIPITRKCRKERITKDIQTSNGSIVRSTSVYYFDESTNVTVDDNLDGDVVLSVSEYRNIMGVLEGYECYV